MPCRAAAQVALSNWDEWIASFVELSPLREGRNSEMWRFHFGWVAVRQPKPTERHFAFWRWSCRIGVEIFSKCKWLIAKSLFMALLRVTLQHVAAMQLHVPNQMWWCVLGGTRASCFCITICGLLGLREWFFLDFRHAWMKSSTIWCWEFQTGKFLDESTDFGTWAPWRS